MMYFLHDTIYQYYEIILIHEAYDESIISFPLVDKLKDHVHSMK